MPTSAKIQLLVVDQTLCDITMSETFDKDTSVFDIGRPSHRDGLACGVIWDIFCLKTFQTMIN